VGGQGGLLDIRLHPDYAKNGWIYLAISKPLPKGSLTSVVRGTLKGNRLEDIETIFEPPAEAIISDVALSSMAKASGPVIYY
jgi:glucose/arabinose dehydrogenase